MDRREFQALPEEEMKRMENITPPFEEAARRKLLPTVEEEIERFADIAEEKLPVHTQRKESVLDLHVNMQEQLQEAEFVSQQYAASIAETRRAMDAYYNLSRDNDAVQEFYVSHKLNWALENLWESLDYFMREHDLLFHQFKISKSPESLQRYIQETKATIKVFNSLSRIYWKVIEDLPHAMPKRDPPKEI